MGEDIRGTEHARCFGDKATEARLRWSGHIQRTDSGSGRGLGRRAKRRVVKRGHEVHGFDRGDSESLTCS